MHGSLIAPRSRGLKTLKNVNIVVCCNSNQRLSYASVDFALNYTGSNEHCRVLLLHQLQRGIRSMEYLLFEIPAQLSLPVQYWLPEPYAEWHALSTDSRAEVEALPCPYAQRLSRSGLHLRICMHVSCCSSNSSGSQGFRLRPHSSVYPPAKQRLALLLMRTLPALHGKRKREARCAQLPPPALRALQPPLAVSQMPGHAHETLKSQPRQCGHAYPSLDHAPARIPRGPWKCAPSHRGRNAGRGPTLPRAPSYDVRAAPYGRGCPSSPSLACTACHPEDLCCQLMRLFSRVLCGEPWPSEAPPYLPGRTSGELTLQARQPPAKRGEADTSSWSRARNQCGGCASPLCKSFEAWL